MKKWEEEQRIKAYQQKIKNARPQVPPTSNPKTSYKIKAQNTSNSRLDESTTSQPSSISGYYQYEKIDKDSIPLYRLLKLNNLQQYAQYLIGRGLGYDLKQFMYLTSKQVEELTEDMKMLPGHKTKFLEMVNLINEMLPQMSAERLQIMQSPLSQDSISKTARINSNIFKKNNLKTSERLNPKNNTQQKQVVPLVKPKSATLQSRIKPQPKKQNLIQVVAPPQRIQSASSATRSQRQTVKQNLTQNSTTSNIPKDNDKNKNKNLRVTNLGCDFFRDEDDSIDQEFNSALDQILKLYMKGDINEFICRPQTVQPTIQNRSTNANTINNTISNSNILRANNRPQQQRAWDDITVVPQIKEGGKIDIQQVQNKQQKLIMRNLERRLVSNTNKLRKKKQLNDEDQDTDFPNLEYSQIKLMYQSYDSGKLTSTLINLDIEEMCNCLGWALLKHIKFQIRKSAIIEQAHKKATSRVFNGKGSYMNGHGDISQNPIEEPTYLQGYNDQMGGLFQSQTHQQDESPIINQQKYSLGCISEKTFDYSKYRAQQDPDVFEHSRAQIEHILRESLVMMRPGQQQHQIPQEQDEDDQAYLADDLYEANSSEEIEDQQEESAMSPRLQQDEDDDSLRYEDDSVNPESNLHQGDMELSLVSRFDVIEGEFGQCEEAEENEKELRSLFQKYFCDSDPTFSSVIPSQEVLTNYCKNIVITSKMEKEVTIISLVYVERLLIKTGLGLEPCNWRKVTFIALVLASKIWDDESFENDNFAKAFPQYTTAQINELERVFLQLIDYKLYVKSGDYAKYYFLLRTYVESRKKSFPLRPLDLNTILNLQRNANKAQRSFMETYNNPLNKSF